MWILLQGWKILLWKCPLLTSDCLPCIPVASKDRIVQGLSAVQAFTPGQLQGRLLLHGVTDNNNSLCDTVTGTPAVSAHTCQSALADPDLCSLFPEMSLPGCHTCF